AASSADILAQFSFSNKEVNAYIISISACEGPNSNVEEDCFKQSKKTKLERRGESKK
ncbi:28830_t:CDS:1, partial [Gigaspora margarita]